MTVPDSYFDTMYAGGPDPWGFTSRWYEQRKYAATLAALPHRRYRSVFEPGCSIGVLSAQLAVRCDRLLCADLAAPAVEATRERVAGFPHVRVERRRLPAEWPDGRFDLIVLSEIGYYLGDADLDLLLDHAANSLAPGGDLVAVHWRHPVADHARRGDEVHARIAALHGLHRQVRHEEKDFLLEVHTAGDTRSVAEREGLC